jgi:hypothetical protein
MFKNCKRPNPTLFCQPGFWLQGIKNHANNVGDSDAVAFRPCFQKAGAAYHTFHTRPAASLPEFIPVLYTSWAKTTDQSCAPRASDPLGDPAPPPYTEHDPQTAGQASRISHHLIINQPVNQISTQQRKFPPAMNGYFQWKLTTTFHLGPSAGEKLHVVSTHTTVLSNKPSVVLHNGLTDKHPVTSDCPW